PAKPVPATALDASRARPLPQVLCRFRAHAMPAGSPPTHRCNTHKNNNGTHNMTPRDLIAGALLACAPLVHAIDLNDDFSLEAKAGIFSDCRTRGISQTQNDPALQG